MPRFALAAPVALAACAAAMLAATPARAGTLTVYTYDSFVAEWGPGPAIAEAWRQRCGCELEWVAVGDAALLLARLRLEGEASPADVVLGLDTNLMAEARAEGLVRDHGLALPPLSLPIPWDDAAFVPFDWGYFAIVYDSDALADPPASMAALASGEEEPKLIVQDPRSSTPGLGLMLWLKALYGDEAGAAWQRLAARVLTVTRGWSEAYGLFLAGEAPMVLSYTTSPAYHLTVEGEDRYRALPFPEGHYMQVEVAAMAAHTARPDLARDFLAFVLSPAFQNAIPTGNWMYPALTPEEGLPPAFRDLPRPARALLLDPEEVSRQRRAWTQEWLEAMSGR